MTVEKNVISPEDDDTCNFIDLYNLSLSPFKAKRTYKNLTQSLYQSLTLKEGQTELSGHNEIIKALTNGICSYFINTMLVNKPAKMIVTDKLNEFDLYFVGSLNYLGAKKYLGIVADTRLDVFDYEAEDNEDKTVKLLPDNILIGIKSRSLGILVKSVDFNTYQNKDTEEFRMIGSCKCEAEGLDSKDNYVCIEL